MSASMLVKYMTGFEIFICIKNKLNLYLLDTYLNHNQAHDNLNFC